MWGALAFIPVITPFTPRITPGLVAVLGRNLVEDRTFHPLGRRLCGLIGGALGGALGRWRRGFCRHVSSLAPVARKELNGSNTRLRVIIRTA
jgi:hypothetical protein